MRRMEQIPSTIEQEPEDTVTLKRGHFYSILVVFAFVVGLLTGYVVWGRVTPLNQAAMISTAIAAQPSGQQSVGQSVQESVAQADDAPTQAAGEFTRYDIPTEGYPSLGPSDAEIVIVEFSDYQ
jgi:protein-disulfide isomerase